MHWSKSTSGEHHSIHTLLTSQSCRIPDKRIRIVQTMYDGFECAVHEDGEQTRWLKVTTGVNQSCIMSGFLFLLTIDWVMQRTTDGHMNGVLRDFTNALEDLDSDPPCNQVRTHPGQDWQTHQKWQQYQIKLNPIKRRVMRIHAKRQDSVRDQHKRK